MAAQRSRVPCRSHVTQEGEGDGEHASLVAAVAKVDRHLVEFLRGKDLAAVGPRLTLYISSRRKGFTVANS